MSLVAARGGPTSEPARRDPGLRRGRTDGVTRLLILLAVALLLRAWDLGNPVIHVDEQFYLVTARALAQGSLPYVDIWDRKPIGLFLLYLPPALLPWRWGVVAYQLLALASAVTTASLVARLAERAGWRHGALSAAVAYLIWLDLLGGVGGQAPVFYNLLMAGAGLLALGSRRAGLAAMALVGLALQVKYSAVFEGAGLGLYLLWRHWRGPAAAVGQAALLAIAALLPTLVAYGAYVGLGQGPAWVYANLASILARRSDPWPEQLGNAATLLLLLSPLIAAAFAAPRDRPAGRFLLGWLAVAVTGVAAFGGWFDHYGLPVLVPGCACAAPFFAQYRRLGAATLMLGAAIGLCRVAVDRHHRGDATQLAALAAAVGSGPGCLWVYSGDTMLYPATGRCMATTRPFPSHLSRAREAGATGVDQAAEVRRILTAAPEAIVMRPPYRGERSEIRAAVVAAVRARYRRVARLPMGREQVEVWRWRGA